MARTEHNGEIIQRVVVLLDGSRASRSALQAAVDYAERRGAELLGLFLEDTDLLRSARLPFGREIGLTSGNIRTVDESALQARLRQRAGELHRLLASTARRRPLRWRFEISRDRPDAITRSTTREGDLLIIARPGWHRGRGPGMSVGLARLASEANCAVLVLGEDRPATDRPVLVLYEHTAVGERAMNVAATMARDASQPLTVLLPPGSSDERIADAARGWAQRHGRRVVLQALSADDAPTLVATLNLQQGQALVLSRDSRAMESPAGRNLLDEIDAPVVVVP
ncbi:universal stress protein [Arhodomonas sp. AD133]|uniref:universal stress protein n=1 Tax=Arhodomonas sp. AD133 TaxID=3415009 RepID=UPI003EBE32E9